MERTYIAFISYRHKPLDIIKADRTRETYAVYPAYTTQELVEKGEKLLSP